VRIRIIVAVALMHQRTLEVFLPPLPPRPLLQWVIAPAAGANLMTVQEGLSFKDQQEHFINLASSALNVKEASPTTKSSV
jgi:hypothetical protein